MEVGLQHSRFWAKIMTATSLYFCESLFNKVSLGFETSMFNNWSKFNFCFAPFNFDRETQARVPKYISDKVSSDFGKYSIL